MVHNYRLNLDEKFHTFRCLQRNGSADRRLQNLVTSNGFDIFEIDPAVFEKTSTKGQKSAHKVHAHTFSKFGPIRFIVT